MAEEYGGGGGIPETVTFIVLLLVVLATLSWIRHGPPSAAHGGVFFQPAPSAPTVNMPSSGTSDTGPTPQSGLRY